MSQTQRDLWPDDVQYDSVVPPAVILREQAALLREKTKGLIVGDVESLIQPAEEVEDYVQDVLGAQKVSIHTHTLYLVVPPLENYRYSLLSVTHDFQPYPCNVRFLPNPRTGTPRGLGFDWHGDQRINTEGEFLRWLQTAFSRQETKRVIYALISRIEKGAHQ